MLLQERVRQGSPVGSSRARAQTAGLQTARRFRDPAAARQGFCSCCRQQQSLRFRVLGKVQQAPTRGRPEVDGYGQAVVVGLVGPGFDGTGRGGHGSDCQEGGKLEQDCLELHVEDKE
ncbi:hypothetical protein MGG_17791 [Pyricularia oryzae 70-15]|uniref:Uncharacterized protein n=1 Tax=Pyricularia oryzae (strain 70-15 / ATCC MYA-4617 / FGSC 8958) TaxID=242507 RepID=G4NHZ9_PYRO7|nr:uncharacterized protein MGG_17791 [Pyricularia oryzae 70-15]EHA47859.1 hypothetical protein MGG_17791 [Pyricularia oryzae 70-15]